MGPGLCSVSENLTSETVRKAPTEREFAYDAGAERSIETARERGWTIVSMLDDWKTVYDVEQ